MVRGVDDDDGATVVLISQNTVSASQSDKVALVARGKVGQRSVGADSWKSGWHVAEWWEGEYMDRVPTASIVQITSEMSPYKNQSYYFLWHTKPFIV